MTYRYTSIGMSLSGKAGKVSYLHDNCAVAFNATLGPNAEKTNETPPVDITCPWCRKGFEGTL